MINFNNRFHGHSSLNYVYKNGQTIRSGWLTLRFIKNTFKPSSRMAVVVGKKVLKSAVGRNRIRRRLYERLRYKLPKLNNIYDIVIVVNSSEIIRASHKDIINQIDQLFLQAKIEK